jgi:hypothetical protein
MAAKTMAAAKKESWFSTHWQQVIVLPIILIVLALAGLVLWPNLSVTGEKGTSSGAKRTESQLMQLASLKSGQKTAPVLFNEQDINAYLESLAKKNGLESMSVVVRKGLISARMVKLFVRVGPEKFKVPIALSYDVKCLPAGGRLNVAQASIGHLKLFGPLTKIAGGAFSKVLAADAQLSKLQGVEEIKIDDGKLSIVVSKK